MRLSRFEIKNFKNLELIEFNWQDIVILIGENNTGKSSVLSTDAWIVILDLEETYAPGKIFLS